MNSPRKSFRFPRRVSGIVASSEAMKKWADGQWLGESVGKNPWFCYGKPPCFSVDHGKTHGKMVVYIEIHHFLWVNQHKSMGIPSCINDYMFVGANTLW